MQRKAAGFFALSLIWGSTWAAIRMVDADVPPIRGVSLRFLVASVVLLPLMFVRRSRLPRGREWGILFGVSTLLTSLSFSLTAWAEQWIGSGKTSILYTIAPLLTVGVERWLGTGSERRPLSTPARLGLLLGVAGTVLVLARSVSLSRNEIRGALAILFVVLLASFTVVPAKHWLREIPVLTVAAVTTLMAGLVLGAVSLVVEGGRPSAWTTSSVSALLFLGVFSSVAGFLLYYWLLQELEPHQLMARHFLMPVVALVEAALYLHEPLSWTLVVGMVTVLAGLGLMLGYDREPVDADRGDLRAADRRS